MAVAKEELRCFSEASTAWPQLADTRASTAATMQTPRLQLRHSPREEYPGRPRSPKEYVPGKPNVGNETSIQQNGFREHLEAIVGKDVALTSLNLAENNIGDEGACVIREVLSRDGHDLRRLDLRSIGLGPQGLLEIGLLLPQCRVLEQVVLSGIALHRSADCGLGERSMADFCDCLIQAPHVRKLHLSYAGLTPAMVCMLGAVLHHEDSGIENLNLSHNNLTCDSMMELGLALKANKALTTLDLSANCLGFRGGEHLANGLSKASGSALRDLRVDRNALELRGCSALARVWNDDKAGPMLESLDLRENKLSHDGVTELCRVFGKLPADVLKFDGSRKVFISAPNRTGTLVRRHVNQDHREAINLFWHDAHAARERKALERHRMPLP